MTGDSNRSVLRSPVVLRLVAAFIVVAVAAVFVLAGLTLWRTKHSVGQLADERQQATAEVIAQTLSLAYEQNGGWSGTDPHPASMLAIQAGAGLTVLDADGTPLELTSRMGAMPEADPSGQGIVRRAPVVVGGRTVGTAVVTFESGELAQAEMHVRDALSGTVVVGALVAALVAAAVAVPLTTRLIKPLRTVTDAAQRLGDGDTTARVGHHDAPGEIGALASSFDDMADRLEAHETTRRNLTADVAHELRTPLTLLQGNCEEIIDGIAEPSLDRFVQMHDDVLRLRRLVDDLGALADADAATTRLGIDHHTCDLAVEVGTVLDGLAPTIEANQQHLQHHLEHVHVDGDAARLGQIVTNLVTNAIKYTPHGGHIIVTVGPGPDDTAVLSVSDDGPGIAAADQPHVFERFYRAETARTAAGSGIGLAVVAQLVAAHHGTVVLVPTAVGTTIEVTFPRVPQSTASKALDQEPSRSRRLGVDG